MNWQRKTLKEIVISWFRGATPTRSKKEYYSDGPGILWARVSDLNEKFLKKTQMQLTEEGADQIRGTVPEGAVLLSVSGTVGKVAIAGARMKLNQAVLGMLFDEEVVLAEYAYYYFQFYRPWLEAKANTVTITNLTKHELEQTSILFPCLEEQKQIVRLMRQAETIIQKQKNTLEAAEEILYSAFYRKLSGLHPEEICLERWLAEPVMVGVASGKGTGIGEYPCMNSMDDRFWSSLCSEEVLNVHLSDAEFRRYRVQEGDILIKRYQQGGSPCCFLVTAGGREAVFGNNFLRIRVQGERLRPEFLLLWLHFYMKYYDYGRGTEKTVMDAAVLSAARIPAVSFELQEECAEMVRRLLEIQRKVSVMERRMDRFYQAMLTAAFTSELTGEYRRFHSLENPERTFVLQHYYARNLEEAEWSENTEEKQWEQIFTKKERQILKYLSDFQREILYKYTEAKEPAPIHVIFKRVQTEKGMRWRKFSVQDAVAAVKILEGLGFLEELVPEKIYFGETVIADLRGKPITIRKYQTAARS